jgi:hypothetical protein
MLYLQNETAFLKKRAFDFEFEFFYLERSVVQSHFYYVDIYRRPISLTNGFLRQSHGSEILNKYFAKKKLFSLTTDDVRG